jgi:hypothetical protein
VLNILDRANKKILNFHWIEYLLEGASKGDYSQRIGGPDKYFPWDKSVVML